MENTVNPDVIIDDIITKLCNIQAPIGLTQTINTPIVQAVQELVILKEIIKKNADQKNEETIDGPDCKEVKPDGADPAPGPDT